MPQPPLSGGGPGGASGVLLLEGLVESADDLRRIIPLFRREKPADEMVGAGAWCAG
jgi:hypothetical protein